MISILIPTHNFDCRPLVKEIHRQATIGKHPFEIIVADDCSTPEFRTINSDIEQLGLLRGLPGYLILFDTHAFVLQCQSWLGKLPSQSGFCVISMHFTATPRIPPASIILKPASFNGSPMVEPLDFTADLIGDLRTL